MLIDETRYNTIEEFTACLLHFQIPFSVKYFLGGAKWTFPFCDGDFICNIAVRNPNMLESMHMPWDEDDVTQLFIPEAMKLLLHFYKSTLDKNSDL